MPVELWLLGTAVLFTVVGIYFQRDSSINQNKKIIGAVIDDLIRQGYIKNYKDSKGETELMKWWEDYPKEVDKSVD